MRSRFEAFRDGDAEWLLASWHPSTRPASLDLTQNPRWRGLQIVDTVAGTAADDTGIVEFRATYVLQGDLQVLHERSRFRPRSRPVVLPRRDRHGSLTLVRVQAPSAAWPPGRSHRPGSRSGLRVRCLARSLLLTAGRPSEVRLRCLWTAGP